MFLQRVSSYFSETTVHGFRYLADLRSSPAERLAWGATIAGAFLACGLLIRSALLEAYDHPIQTTSFADAVKVVGSRQFDFPT